MFCKSCNRELEAIAFRPLNKSTCIECLNARQREYRKRDWYKASMQKHESAHKKEHRARAVLRMAVYRGEIVKTPCMVCGAEKVEAHHADYDRPRDVIWLCRPHHVGAHAIARAAA